MPAEMPPRAHPLGDQLVPPSWPSLCRERVPRGLMWTWGMRGAELERGEEQSCRSVRARAAGAAAWMHPQSCLSFPGAQSNPDPAPKGSWIVPSCSERARCFLTSSPLPRGSWRGDLCTPAAPWGQPRASSPCNALPEVGGEGRNPPVLKCGFCDTGTWNSAPVWRSARCVSAAGRPSGDPHRRMEKSTSEHPALVWVTSDSFFFFFCFLL